MSDKIASWLYDDTPLKHKIVRLIFFLTSFSWTFNPRQDYTYSGGDTPIEKIITRMIPMLIVAVYAMTCKHHHELRRLFRPGLWPLLWYVLFAVLCGFSGIQPALCAWKGAEIIIVMSLLLAGVSSDRLSPFSISFGHSEQCQLQFSNTNLRRTSYSA